MYDAYLCHKNGVVLQMRRRPTRVTWFPGAGTGDPASGVNNASGEPPYVRVIREIIPYD